MKHTLRQVFRSGKFVTGFIIFMSILLIVILYPIVFPTPPLEIIGQGTFFEPGIYVNVYDSIGGQHYTLHLDNAAAKRIASKLDDDDRLAMKEWLVAVSYTHLDVYKRQVYNEAQDQFAFHRSGLTAGVQPLSLIHI